MNMLMGLLAALTGLGLIVGLHVVMIWGVVAVVKSVL